MTDQPLPGMPEPPARRRVPARPDIRAARIRGDRLCERCCQLIHQLGAEVAPYPRPRRWRVTTADGVELLCDLHKDERLGKA